jgi:hypothetical protein
MKLATAVTDFDSKFFDFCQDFWTGPKRNFNLRGRLNEKKKVVPFTKESLNNASPFILSASNLTKPKARFQPELSRPFQHRTVAHSTNFLDRHSFRLDIKSYSILKIRSTKEFVELISAYGLPARVFPLLGSWSGM